MADPGERQLALLLAALKAMPSAQRPLVADVEAAISGSPTLENAARAALGIYAKMAGLAGPPEAERWRAIYQSLAGALAAADSDQLRVAVSSLGTSLSRLAAEESTRWVAFVPLESTADQVAQPSYALDGSNVRASVLPPTGASTGYLQELAFQFDISPFALSENIATSSLAVVITGSQARAAERALARFADVRDAARAAWLLAHETPRAPASAVELTSKWVRVTLVQGDGSANSVHSVRGSDVRLEIDPAALVQPPARTLYGQIVKILATPSPVVEARDGQESPEGRLARSCRVIARSWVQASFDVRYLLVRTGCHRGLLNLLS